MQTIETTCGTLTNLGNGIAHIIFNSELVSVEDVAIYGDQCLEFTKGKSIPFLVDLRQMKKTNREVRKRFASKHIAKSCKATALIVGSGFSKIAGNIFLMANKPPYPSKLFTDPKKAETWLLQFV
ncbi:MAG: hypothetical protein MK212_15335 [Saprospiraceae bacterium]|nr:hypothetical protein [Saprospiraceae bacterium]